MRILALGLAVGALSFTSCSNEINSGEVPSVVVNAFKAEYPDAQDLEWEKETDYYQVEFEENGIEKDVRIDHSGTIQLYIEEVALDDLPVKIKNAISTSLADAELDDIEKITMLDGQVYYQVESGGMLKDNAHVFNINGEKVENISF